MELIFWNLSIRCCLCHLLSIFNIDILCDLILALVNMQSIRDTILRYVRVRRYSEPWLSNGGGNVLNRLSRQMCASSATSPDQIMGRVIGLVKKFDKIDTSKVINWCPVLFYNFSAIDSCLWLIRSFYINVACCIMFWTKKDNFLLF